MAKQNYPNEAPTISYLNSSGRSARFEVVKQKSGTIITICAICENDKSIFIGVAECAPTDAYNRKKGNAIAMGRAWKNLSSRLRQVSSHQPNQAIPQKLKAEPQQGEYPQI